MWPQLIARYASVGLRLSTIAAWLLLVAPDQALAHGVQAPEHAWSTAWPSSVDAIIALVIASVLYVRGVKRLRGKSLVAHQMPHWAFFGGLAAVFLALVTPLDVVAEHLFSVHQVQHLLLRGVAPMLLMLAVPAGPLIAGIPAIVRRRLLVPLMGQPAVRRAFRLLTHPVICTLLYVGTLYAWQVPAIHSAALLDGPVHYLMHLTMLISGLLFFWRVFDAHPPPWGTPFHQRLVMLGAAMFANIPIGAFITLKSNVIYVTYDFLGRWWGLDAMNDELLGGLVIWILGSMMGLPAVLWLVALWSRSEVRQHARVEQGFGPVRDAAAATNPASARRLAGRKMGWALAVVPLAMFAGVALLAFWLLASH